MEKEIMNNEFTFKQLFSLIKKSGVRILIFCLVAAFIVGVAGIGVYFGTKDNNATVSALVDFNFSGIEQGKDPFGRDFDVTKIKSPSVIDDAIQSLKARGINVNTSKLDAIINNITIEGIVPEDIMSKILVIKEIATKTPGVLTELNNLTYFPSRYKISIGNLKDTGLSKQDARILLNEIITQYIAFFKKTYANQKLLPSDVIEITALQGTTSGTDYNYDFIELYDIYYAQIVSALSYLEAKNLESSSFRSNETGKTFEDLIYSIKIIRDTDLVKYEAFVVQNGISDNKEFIMSYLERRQETLTNQQDRAIADAEKISEAIPLYKNGDIIYITESGTTTAIGGPTAQYDRMFSQLIETQKEINRIQQELDNLEKRIEKYNAAGSAGNTEENRNYAAARSKGIASQLKEAIDSSNITIQEYYDTEYFNNAVKTAVPAVYENNQSSNFMIIIVAFVAAVAVAAVAAVIVTYSSLKKKGISL